MTRSDILAAGFAPMLPASEADWRALLPSQEFLAGLGQRQIRMLVDLMGTSRSSMQVAEAVDCSPVVVIEARRWKERLISARHKANARSRAAALKAKPAKPDLPTDWRDYVRADARFAEVPPALRDDLLEALGVTGITTAVLAIRFGVADDLADHLRAVRRRGWDRVRKRTQAAASAPRKPEQLEAPPPAPAPARVTDASRNYPRKGEGGEGREFRDTPDCIDHGGMLAALRRVHPFGEGEPTRETLGWWASRHSGKPELSTVQCMRLRAPTVVRMGSTASEAAA